MTDSGSRRGWAGCADAASPRVRGVDREPGRRSAFFAVSGMPEWIDVARSLSKQASVDPVYWLTVPKIEGAVAAAFPEIVRHAESDAVRGRGPASLSSLPLQPPAGDELEHLASYERVMMDLMTRMDLGGSFPFDARRLECHRQFTLWLTLVRALRPDVVFFNVAPHALAYYGLYAVCRLEGIETAMLVYTHIDGLLMVADGIENTPVELDSAVRRRLATDASQPTPHAHRVTAHLARLRSSEAEAKPWYLLEAQRRDAAAARPGALARARSVFGSASRRLLRVTRWWYYVVRLPSYAMQTFRYRRHIDNRPMRDMYKQQGKTLAESVVREGEFRHYQTRSVRRKRHLQDHYDRLVQPLLLDGDFIYAPLHHQPERTTVPDGGVFGDHVAQLALLSACLPAGWTVLVKEHPSQLSAAGFGEQARNEAFYDTLATMPGVRFVPRDAPSFELIDRSRAVATITGSSAWEAVVRGVPALVFGHVWFRTAPGVFAVQTRAECETALARIAAGFKVDANAVEAFAHAVADVAVYGYMNPSGAAAVDIAYPDHVANLTEAFYKVLRDRSGAHAQAECHQECSTMHHNRISVQFGERSVGDDHPVFITLEAGPTHDSLESAKRLVSLAAASGADAVKFQIFDPDRLVADRTQPFSYDVLVSRETGETETVTEPLYDILCRRCLEPDEWLELKRHSDSYRLAFFATVGFAEDIALLERFECDSIKIASADVNHTPLIRAAAATGMCIQLDTGSASLGEIETAVDLIRGEGNERVIIHQCPSGYPARLTSINLRVLQTLRQMFPYPIAYSDHTPGHDMDVAAAALGANLVEKTITENREIRSVEHIMSLEPGQLEPFVQAMRDVQVALGEPRRILSPEELTRRKSVRRSMFLRTAVRRGEILAQADIDFRRPGDGLPPTDYESLGTTRFTRDLPAGHKLALSDLGQ